MCSHAAALLFKLETCTQLELNKTASTSELCAWKRSRKQAEASPLKKIDFTRPKVGSLPKEFPSCGQSECPYSYSDPSLNENSDNSIKLNQLKLIAPNAAIFTSISGGTRNQQESSGTETADENESDILPEPLSSLYMPDYANLS